MGGANTQAAGFVAPTGKKGAGGQLYVTPGSSSGSSLELEAHIDEREEGEGGSGCDIDQSDLDSFKEFRVVDESDCKSPELEGCVNQSEFDSAASCGCGVDESEDDSVRGVGEVDESRLDAREGAAGAVEEVELERGDPGFEFGSLVVRDGDQADVKAGDLAVAPVREVDFDSRDGDFRWDELDIRGPDSELQRGGVECGDDARGKSQDCEYEKRLFHSSEWTSLLSEELVFGQRMTSARLSESSNTE